MIAWRSASFTPSSASWSLTTLSARSRPRASSFAPIPRSKSAKSASAGICQKAAGGGPLRSALAVARRPSADAAPDSLSVSVAAAPGPESETSSVVVSRSVAKSARSAPTDCAGSRTPESPRRSPEHGAEQHREEAALLGDGRLDRLHAHVDVRVVRRGLARGSARQPGPEERERLRVPRAHETERRGPVRRSELAGARVVVPVVGLVVVLRASRARRARPLDEEDAVVAGDELVVLGERGLRGVEIANPRGHGDLARKAGARARDGDGEVDRAIEIDDRPEALAREDLGHLLRLRHRKLRPSVDDRERRAELRERARHHQTGRRRHRAQVGSGRQRDAGERRGGQRRGLGRRGVGPARDGGAGKERQDGKERPERKVREQRTVRACEGARHHGFVRESIREPNSQSSLQCARRVDRRSRSSRRSRRSRRSRTLVLVALVSSLSSLSPLWK